MSAGNPISISSGLILCYDIANPASYVGAPTTNIINSQSLGLSTYAYVTGPTSVTSSVGAFGENASVNRYTITSATNFARAKLAPNISFNTPYTFTYLIRYNGKNTTSASYYASAGKPNPESGNNITMSLDTYTQYPLENGWSKVTHYFNITSASINSCILSFGVITSTDANYVGNTFDVYQLQLEPLSYATQYTPTARSAVSGSLFDRVSGAPIDASASGFSTGALPTFSGSNYLTLPYNSTLQLTGSTGWTWDFWYKAYSTVGYRPLYYTGPYQNVTGYSTLYFNPGTMTFRLEASSGSANQGGAVIVDKILSHPTVAVGSFYNATLTYNGFSWSLYHNGNYVDGAPWTGGLGNITTAQKIGAFWAGNWHGEIPIHRQYNRALPSYEIQSNYNQMKSRFGY
jgi:hypothetical protein